MGSSPRPRDPCHMRTKSYRAPLGIPIKTWSLTLTLHGPRLSEASSRSRPLHANIRQGPGGVANFGQQATAQKGTRSHENATRPSPEYEFRVQSETLAQIGPKRSAHSEFGAPQVSSLQEFVPNICSQRESCTQKSHFANTPRKARATSRARPRSPAQPT